MSNKLLEVAKEIFDFFCKKIVHSFVNISHTSHRNWDIEITKIKSNQRGYLVNEQI